MAFKKTKDHLKILLLQIRDGPKVRQEEHESFAQYSGLRLEQITILNVFDSPNFSTNIINDYDALFVGGASEASVLEPETYPFIQTSIDLLKHCLNINLPVFASCFGFQLAVLALDGLIIRDSRNFEMGTLPISLTKEAQQDALFHDTPNNFYAVSVHKEKSEIVPTTCTELAFTKACCHSFRVKNKPFWAFQFHPEVDRITLVERLTFFKDTYTKNNSHLQEILDHAVETPESNGLLNKFIERVVIRSLPLIKSDKD